MAAWSVVMLLLESFNCIMTGICFSLGMRIWHRYISVGDL